VVSDITGVRGLAILKDILRGQRDPVQLAKHRDRRCKNPEATIAQALNGSYWEEHLFALQQALDSWEFYQQQLRAVDDKIQQQLVAMKKRQELPPLPRKPRRCKRKHNEPRFDVRTALYYVRGVDLTAVEGLDDLTALTVVSETGTDMTRWPTVKHFTSWLGLCPQFKKTGGHVKSSRTRPGSNRLAVWPGGCGPRSRPARAGCCANWRYPRPAAAAPSCPSAARARARAEGAAELLVGGPDNKPHTKDTKEEGRVS
jgi:hypothetical protein